MRKMIVGKFIGTHVDGYPTPSVAPAMAHGLGATAFAFNMVDPSRWRSSALSDAEANAFRDACAEYGYTSAQILPHAGFVINLCSPDPQKLKLSCMALEDEMIRAAKLGLTMVNFHPGAHLKKMTEDEALLMVAKSINTILGHTSGVTAVIENTAGQGSNIGYSFAHLATIIQNVDDKTRVGVCIDTAHAFAGGYDLSTAEGYDAVWAEFEQTIGFEYLRGMHLNDSQRQVGSRIDRHAPIGAGFIGADCFKRLMQDCRFDGIPMILETPDPSLWASEIATLKTWASE